MRLPDLHRRLLGDAVESGEAYRLVLAGGYAIQAHELVSRTSQDVDLATDASAGMAEITAVVPPVLRTGAGRSVSWRSPRACPVCWPPMRSSASPARLTF